MCLCVSMTLKPMSAVAFFSTGDRLKGRDQTQRERDKPTVQWIDWRQSDTRITVVYAEMPIKINTKHQV